EDGRYAVEVGRDAHHVGDLGGRRAQGFEEVEGGIPAPELDVFGPEPDGHGHRVCVRHVDGECDRPLEPFGRAVELARSRQRAGVGGGFELRADGAYPGDVDRQGTEPQQDAQAEGRDGGVRAAAPGSTRSVHRGFPRSLPPAYRGPGRFPRRGTSRFVAPSPEGIGPLCRVAATGGSMPTVLITGANRGIGLALAEAMAARGDRVLATAREGADVAALQRVASEVLPLEVTDDASVEALAGRLAGTPIDLL